MQWDGFSLVGPGAHSKDIYLFWEKEEISEIFYDALGLLF
jgi:hypothetical protein